MLYFVVQSVVLVIVFVAHLPSWVWPLALNRMSATIQTLSSDADCRSIFRPSYVHIFSFACLNDRAMWNIILRIYKSRLKTDGIEINCPGLMAKYLKMLLTSLLFLATGILQPLLRVNCFSPFDSTKSQSTNIGSLQWNKSHISDLRQNCYISVFR